MCLSRHSVPVTLDDPQKNTLNRVYKDYLKTKAN